jgi:hypothetical protein
LVIVNQEERWLEELSYQLQLSDEITASGLFGVVVFALWRRDVSAFSPL